MPFSLAFVRAGGFFENYIYGLKAATGGSLPMFYTPTHRKVGHIATADIGDHCVARPACDRTRAAGLLG
jgi:hypothetical protein